MEPTVGGKVGQQQSLIWREEKWQLARSGGFQVDNTAVHWRGGFQVEGNTREIWWQVLNTALVVGSLSTREGSGQF